VHDSPIYFYFRFTKILKIYIFLNISLAEIFFKKMTQLVYSI